MFIQTPADAIAMGSASAPLGQPSRAMFATLITEDASFFLEHVDAQPTPRHFQSAADHLSEITELPFDEASTRQLLALYPRARILVAVGEGARSSGAREALAEAASMFFMACPWPCYGDKVDIDAFVAQLKAMSESIGFPDGSV